MSKNDVNREAEMSKNDDETMMEEQIGKLHVSSGHLPCYLYFGVTRRMIGASSPSFLLVLEFFDAGNCQFTSCRKAPRLEFVDGRKLHIASGIVLPTKTRRSTTYLRTTRPVTVEYSRCKYFFSSIVPTFFFEKKIPRANKNLLVFSVLN